MSDPFYITTPIYYVNDVPHIGHAYTTVAADVLARYHRLRGRDVFFLTGVDEHGQKVQQAAAKTDIEPKAYCDQIVPRFKTLWQRLHISHDGFIRTTDAQHTTIVQRYLQLLFDKQLIYSDQYTGWYCTFDERFWTEKDVEGGVCPDCRRPVEKLSERNYFFKMGQYQERLIAHIEANPEFVRPESRRNEVLGFLRTQQLGDLSISRPKSRLSWGIELPFDREYVTYVWFDALVNYLSALEYLAPPASTDRFWPADVHLVGKDILTTHAVYWSTILMALERPLPRTIFAHGWWTVEGEKMSKSRGNVVDPHAMADEFGVDAFRYFLLREVPFGHDGDFSVPALVTRINGDLANGIGNLLSRTVTMIERFADGRIPERGTKAHAWNEETIRKEVEARPLVMSQHLSAFHFNHDLESISMITRLCDQLIDESQPWRLHKQATERPVLSSVLNTLARALRALSICLYPYMPQTADEMQRQLGLTPDWSRPLLDEKQIWQAPISGTVARTGKPLFPRILSGSDAPSPGEKQPAKMAKKDRAQNASYAEGAKTVTDTPTPATPQATAPAAAATPTAAVSSAPVAPPPPAQITIDEFMKIQLRTAKVLTAERVPKSEKLIKLQVDLGVEQRQIVAGIGKKYEPESLVGKIIVIVANLKPAKLMGIESQGMVLAAGDTDVRGLVTIAEDVEPGTKVK